MSVVTESTISQDQAHERLAFERYRVQSVFETHARMPETITGVVSDYINAIHLLRPSHIFEPIMRNDSTELAIGITEELEQVIQPMRSIRETPHSGEVYGVFVEYIKDDHATMLREELKVSAIPRAVTLTLAHFILGGVTEITHSD